MTEAFRLRHCYFWIYALVGVLGPFFGPYLHSLGLSGIEVGVLAAITPVAMAVVPPLWGAAADRLGETTTLLRVVLFGATLALVPFPFASQFAPLAAILALFALFRAGTGPLLDSITFTLIERDGGEFGRTRVWGSVGFLASSTVVAVLADAVSDVVIAVALVTSQGLAALSSLAVPRAPRPQSVNLWADLRTLMSGWPFRLFLVATFFENLAASAPLVFYPLHLREAGASNVYIAAFWATGVLAEVALFQFAPALLARVRPGSLYLAAFVAVALRYGLLLVVTDPIAIVGIQVLHALSFGAFYYASVTWLAQTVPVRLRATGQAVFAAVGFGIAGGTSSLLGGWLFDHGHIEAVLIASVAAGVVGLVCALPTAARMNHDAKGAA